MVRTATATTVATAGSPPINAAALDDVPERCLLVLSTDTARVIVRACQSVCGLQVLEILRAMLSYWLSIERCSSIDCRILIVCQCTLLLLLLQNHDILLN